MWRTWWTIGGCALMVSFTSTALPAHGAERPQIQLDRNNAGDLYSRRANISVMGTVQPALRAQVTVRLYHVQDDGGLLYQSGASLELVDGRIGPFSISPPAEGWKAGTLRCVLFLSQMPQVRSSFDVSIVEEDLPPVKAIYEPKVSDVIVNVHDAPQAGWTINAGERFYIRGTVILPERFELQGPSVFAKLVRPANDDRPAVTFVSSSTICILELPTIGDYEIEMDAPRRPGEYVLHVYEPAFVGGQEVKPAPLVFPLTLRSAESPHVELPRLD